jgi:G protein-coupled receptor 107
MHINVKDFKLDGHAPGMKAMKIGFLMRKADTESAAQEDLEKALEEGACLLEQLHPNDVFLDISKTSQVNMKVETGAEGLYSFIFARCDPSGHHTVSFKMHADFHNPGPNYLSAGDSALPLVYFVFFLLFTMALLVWIWVLCRPSSSHVTVLSIHYLMGALLVVKCACLLVESIRFHFISLTGASATWSIVYYVVTSLRGVMLFTVILLIGSGWSLLKQYLNDREKKIILVVLTMQVFDNVAMIVLEETAPGSQGWLTWRDMLHLVDVMCCCAILFPIVWSIKHLRQAAEVDGKAQVK